ncbi:MAG: hypothetical protein IBJ00_02815 [Alphaproteobacteria bacterium]|nr:hypothetical protein [Alphaproteobacteria bacterium]
MNYLGLFVRLGLFMLCLGGFKAWAAPTLVPQPEYARQSLPSPSKDIPRLPALVKPLLNENQVTIKSIEQDKQMIKILNKRLEDLKASPHPTFKDKRAIHSVKQLISELEKNQLEKEDNLEALKHPQKTISKDSAKDNSLKKNTPDGRLAK